MSDVTPFEPEHEDDSGRAFPWAPQPGETSLGFQSFATYRDAGPKRTIASVARQLGRDAGTLRMLSAKYSWVDRALAFDAYLDKRSVEELARGRTQMRQEHADVAVLARTKILTRLKSMNPDELSVRDLAAWLELAVKLERQARGEPDKTVSVSGEVNVVEALGASERRSLMEQALSVLSERLGVTQPVLEGIVEAELVEDGGEAAS